MKIIEGNYPEEKVWLALVLLVPGEPLGKAWQLGLHLAQANGGELLAAVVVGEAGEEQLREARAAVQTAQEAAPPDDNIYTIIIEARDYERGLRELVEEAEVDLLLTQADAATWYNLNKIPCAVSAVRGDRADPETVDADVQESQLQHILVPTSGGPNTIYALNMLLPLTPETKVTALYVASADLGSNEEALGRSRLRQVLSFIDGRDRIETKLITTDSITAGIVEEASKDYDLIIIGASQESSVDKVLFGDIPAVVVRQTKKPVMIVREPKDPIGNLWGAIAWQLQHLLPRMDISDRTEAYVRIRRSARPDRDYFILIGLSTLIAALGLILSSPAVVIGAMLVAPLMSPIVGTGLALVLGNARFLRLSLGAVSRGVLLAVFLGALIGFLHLNQPLTPELQARTQPTLLDLGVALFSGMAGAYALSHSAAAAALPGVAIAAALVPPLATIGIALSTGHYREALGATLLFTTNFVAMSSATALVFLILGFRPTQAQKERRVMQARSTRVALILLVTISLILSVTTYRLAQQTNQQTRIREVVRQSVADVTGGTLTDDGLEIVGDVIGEGELQLELIVRSSERIPHSKVVDLQDRIAIELQRNIQLTMTVILVTELDPGQAPPPTQTPTPTVTNTPTPGPTPTFTNTPTRTPTPPPTPTPTFLPTVTSTALPTATATALPTATATPTPPTAVVSSPYGLNLRAAPDLTAEIVRFLEAGQVVVLLEGRETAGAQTWQLVEAEEQRGWVVETFLQPPGP